MTSLTIISSLILLLAVGLKCLGLQHSALGIVGLIAVFVLLISSFKSVFLNDEDLSH